jgi:hypothetical protein
MSKSKGPGMNGVQTIEEASCGINDQLQTQTMCLAGEVKGGTRTKSRDSLAGETANPNTCLVEEGNRGANEYNEFEPERQQELKLVFGQRGGGHKHRSLLLLL